MSEPVAYINKDDGLVCAKCFNPLYTHPVKELTDEEIKSEAKYFCHSYHSENPERLVLFARAIIKKAQEK